MENRVGHERDRPGSLAWRWAPRKPRSSLRGLPGGDEGVLGVDRTAVRELLQLHIETEIVLHEP